MMTTFQALLADVDLFTTQRVYVSPADQTAPQMLLRFQIGVMAMRLRAQAKSLKKLLGLLRRRRP